MKYSTTYSGKINCNKQIPEELKQRMIAFGKSKGWVVNNTFGWDANPYECVVQLRELIDKFLKPDGYILNGVVEYQGNNPSDFGKIIAIDNQIELKEGEIIYGMDDFSDDELIEELERRGYTVTGGV